jgi:hypothetical protein
MQAKKDGALRSYPVEEQLSGYTELRVGQIGDLMDIIDVAVGMMDAGETINYYLTKNGEVIDEEINDSPDFVLRNWLMELGEAIEEGDPQYTADMWLRIKERIGR